MIVMYPKSGKALRPIAWLLTILLTMPLFAGCGGSKTSAPPPPVDDAARTTTNSASVNQTQQKKGLSTGQKVAITLVGAAALYYLYRQHQKKQGQGPNGQYYLSKNGRVYYRDAQHRAHYVSAPSGGVQVPSAEAQQYSQFQGYDGRNTGRDLSGLGQAPAQ